MKYIKYLDGLRALAISLVLIFHFYPKILPGGFIGVDIFFVISGFLITSLIYTEILQSGSFSLIKFYNRRIKRILPALLVLFTVTFIISYIFLLPMDFENFVHSMVYGIFSLSNIWFSHQSNYFVVSSFEVPLLHTWTLGVEEQYYIIWALLFFMVSLLFRKKPKLFVIAIVFLSLTVFASSIILAILFANGDKIYAQIGYYSVITRSYEFMVGSILALLTVTLNNSNNTKYLTLKKISSNVLLSNILSFIGLIFIIISTMLFSSKSNFPSYYALLPSLGASLIIYGGYFNSKNLLNKIFEIKAIVFIGLISYSLYLWHWVILAFYRYEVVRTDLTIIEASIIFLITLIISIISYFFVEKPIRKSKSNFIRSLLLYYILPAVLLCSIANYTLSKGGSKTRLLNKNYYTTFGFTGDFYCHHNSIIDLRAPKDGPCTFGANLKSKPRILLFGDSHAANYAAFWEEIAKKYNFNFDEHSTGTCPASMLGAKNKNNYYKYCFKYMVKYATKNINNYDVFILGGAWDTYGKYDKNAHGNNTENMDNALAFLSKKKKIIIVMQDIPNIRNADKFNRVSFRKNKLLSLIVQENLQKNTLIDLSPIYFSDNNIKPIAKKYGAYYFETYNTIHMSKSYPFYNNIFMYINGGHLNIYGSKALGQEYINNPKINKEELLKFMKINNTNK